jgi:tetratricopeptide (TPR) repeat protein
MRIQGCVLAASALLLVLPPSTRADVMEVTYSIVPQIVVLGDPGDPATHATGRLTLRYTASSSVPASATGSGFTAVPGGATLVGGQLSVTNTAYYPPTGMAFSGARAGGKAEPHAGRAAARLAAGSATTTSGTTLRPMRRLAVPVAAVCLGLTTCSDAQEQAERARLQARQALARGERDAALDAIASLRRAGPDTPETIHEHASLLIHAGEAPRVVWLLEDAVARYPHEPTLVLLLAEAALLVNDPVRAEAAARRVPADAEVAGRALVMRARAALALGDLERAMDLFRRAEQVEPARLELRAPRVAALLAERRFEDAASALAEAKAQVTKPDAPLLASMELALHQYRSADARRRVLQAGGNPEAAAAARRDFDGAIEDAGAMARAAPRHLGAWQLFAQGMLATGRASEAATALEAALAEDPEALALLPLLARARLALGDADAAERALRDLAGQDPPSAVLPLARFLVARERGAEALALVGAAQVRAGDDPTLAQARAELLLDEERLAEARDAIAQLRAQGTAPPVELLGARLALAEGDPQGAARRLERLAPELDTAPTHYWLAKALEASGDRAGAERRYALAAQRSPAEIGAYAELLRLARERGAWPEAAAAGRQLAQLAPGRIDGWEGLVGALLQLAKTDEALAVADHAAAVLPEDPHPRLLRARALRAQGRHAEALDTLLATRERFGASTELAAEQVLALTAAGRAGEALRTAERALGDAPDAAPLHHAHAIALFAEDRFREGSRAVDRAVEQDPGDPSPLRTRCRFGAATGRFDAARSDCGRYLAQRPDDAEVHFARGAALDAGGDPEAAIAAYRRAAALDSRAAAPRNNLAVLLHRRGDLDAALLASQEAYALADQNPQVLDTLGQLYLAKGLHDRAISILESAHRLDPDLAAAELHLAQAYAEAGRRPEARRHLEDIIQRGEASPLHKEAKRTLSRL